MRSPSVLLRFAAAVLTCTGLVAVAAPAASAQDSATQEVTFTLEAGNYVLLCNIFDEEEDEAHYALGMRVAFPVR